MIPEHTVGQYRGYSYEQASRKAVELTKVAAKTGQIIRLRDHLNELAPYFRESQVVNEGPIRTVTRQEIIPGTYDGVEVRPHSESSVYVEYCGEVKTADELTRAAAVLTALAGALRDAR